MSQETHDVVPELFASGSATGRNLSVITPNAKGAMFALPRASAEAMPEEMAQADFHGAPIVRIESHMLFPPDLNRVALEKEQVDFAHRLRNRIPAFGGWDVPRSPDGQLNVPGREWPVFLMEFGPLLCEDCPAAFASLISPDSDLDAVAIEPPIRTSNLKLHAFCPCF